MPRLATAVESTDGVSQSLPGREFLRWAPSPFGATVSFTEELRVYPGLTRNPPSAVFWIRRLSYTTTFRLLLVIILINLLVAQALPPLATRAWTWAAGIA